MDEDRGVRPVLVDLAFEIVERHAEVIAVAVDELDDTACRLDREGGGHEGVRRAQNGTATDGEELERGEGRACPARGRDGRQAVPRGPRFLEPASKRPVRPEPGVERLVPERVQALAVAVVESDGELTHSCSVLASGVSRPEAEALRDYRDSDLNII